MAICLEVGGGGVFDKSFTTIVAFHLSLARTTNDVAATSLPPKIYVINDSRFDCHYGQSQVAR